MTKFITTIPKILVLINHFYSLTANITFIFSLKKKSIYTLNLH